MTSQFLFLETGKLTNTRKVQGGQTFLGEVYNQEIIPTFEFCMSFQG